MVAIVTAHFRKEIEGQRMQVQIWVPLQQISLFFSSLWQINFDHTKFSVIGCNRVHE